MLADHPGVRVSRVGDHVAELVLDRPEAMNAVSTQQARSLAVATTALAADRSVRAVLVTSSSPKAFCVGADLKERSSFTEADLRAQRPVARSNAPGHTLAGVALVRHEKKRGQLGRSFASSPAPRQCAGRGYRRGLDGPSMPNPF